MNNIIKELSISVACMLDELDDIKQKDVEHLQDLITKLEKGNNGR